MVPEADPQRSGPRPPRRVSLAGAGSRPRVSGEAVGVLAGSRKLGVNRVVHVAVPNAGTPLTDTPHLNDLIDTYTNIFDFLPDSPTSLVLDGLFVVAKQLAANTVKGLDGLEAMLPTGRFLREWLNVGTVPRDTSPSPRTTGRRTWSALLGVRPPLLQDLPQGRERPRRSHGQRLRQERGPPRSPSPTPAGSVFSPEDGVTHGGYFAHEPARKAILDWLTEP